MKIQKKVRNKKENPEIFLGKSFALSRYKKAEVGIQAFGVKRTCNDEDDMVLVCHSNMEGKGKKSLKRR